MPLGVTGYFNTVGSVKTTREDRTSKNHKTNSSGFSDTLEKTAQSVNKDAFVPSQAETDSYVVYGYGRNNNNSSTDADGKSGSQSMSGNRSAAQNASDAAKFNVSASEDVMHMSATERTNLVDRLQDEQKTQTHQFLNMVRKSLGYQASEFVNAEATPSVDENGIWHFLASGNYTVDIATKTKAQESISENGYYGVKQTSQRLFDFAAAVAGDDVDAMKKMQSAIEDGFSQATKAWGQSLPQICADTKEATNQLFENYYQSKSEASSAVGA